jgi:hypothetical protein
MFVTEMFVTEMFVTDDGSSPKRRMSGGKK